MQLLTVLSENWNLVRLFLISSVQSKINACAIFFAHSRERSTSYYNLLEILNLDDIAKSKTVVFTHKILEKKGIPAISSDFIIPAVDIHSQNSICYPRKFL